MSGTCKYCGFTGTHEMLADHAGKCPPECSPPDQRQNASKYVKIIPCIKCDKPVEVRITKNVISKHGHWKRICPHCHARWRVSNQKAFLSNPL